MKIHKEKIKINEFLTNAESVILDMGLIPALKKEVEALGYSVEVSKSDLSEATYWAISQNGILLESNISIRNHESYGRVHKNTLKIRKENLKKIDKNQTIDFGVEKVNKYNFVKSNLIKDIKYNKDNKSFWISDYKSWATFKNAFVRYIKNI